MKPFILSIFLCIITVSAEFKFTTKKQEKAGEIDFSVDVTIYKDGSKISLGSSCDISSPSDVFTSSNTSIENDKIRSHTLENMAAHKVLSKMNDNSRLCLETSILLKKLGLLNSANISPISFTSSRGRNESSFKSPVKNPKPTNKGYSDPSEWERMVMPCIRITSYQIGCKIRASLEYFRFGVHFSRDDVNRPGFAKFFFDSASEEREHAMKLIDYLAMRGAARPFKEKLSILNFLENARNCPIFTIYDDCTRNGHEALKCALDMEVNVTKHFYEVIQKCEAIDCNNIQDCRIKASHSNASVNDANGVYNLTGEFLEEQYKGQREIARKMKTLEELTDTHGNIGEFLFDKQILG